MYALHSVALCNRGTTGTTGMSDFSGAALMPSSAKYLVRHSAKFM